MRAIVTGGAGFIGSHLVDALLARGDEVTVVDDLSGPGSTRNIAGLLDHPRFRFIRADLCDWAPESDLTGFDVVFHEACTSLPVSMADPERDLRTNALGTLRLLEAVVRGRVGRYVHASTGSVFGEPLGVQDEDHPTRPVSFYGASKLAGEAYVRVMAGLHDLSYIVLRYYNVIGPRQNASDGGGVVPIFVRRALAGQPLNIHGTGEQVRSFTNVHDVVRANLLVADHPDAHGFYNVGAERPASIRELAEFIRAEVRPVPIVHAPRRAGDIDELRVDASRIRALGLTFEPDWRVAVRAVVDSMAVAA